MIPIDRIDHVVLTVKSIDVACNFCTSVAGPVRRSGAAGSSLSVDFRDPDNDLIDVSTH
jgi:hypothetical protein